MKARLGDIEFEGTPEEIKECLTEETNNTRERKLQYLRAYAKGYNTAKKKVKNDG